MNQMELEECWTETELSDMGGETHRLGELLNGAVNLLFLLRDAACVLTQAYLDALSRWVEQNPQEDRRIRVVVNSAPKGAAASLRGKSIPLQSYVMKRETAASGLERVQLLIWRHLATSGPKCG